MDAQAQLDDQLAVRAQCAAGRWRSLRIHALVYEVQQRVEDACAVIRRVRVLRMDRRLRGAREQLYLDVPKLLLDLLPPQPLLIDLALLDLGDAQLLGQCRLQVGAGRLLLLVALSDLVD